MSFSNPRQPLPRGRSGPTVFAVMEQWAIPDNGDRGITLEAIHATRQGAEANLSPADPSGLRERFVVSVEVQL